MLQVKRISQRRMLFYGTFTTFIVLSTVYLLLPSQLKLSYIIDNTHIAKIEPQGTWLNMTCPQCKSKLEKIGIYTSEDTDAAWRVAFYCRQDDIFWVYDFPGGISESRWYGPFSAYWKITDTAAIGIIIISSVIIVLMVTRDKGYMKRRIGRSMRASPNYTQTSKKTIDELVIERLI
jgi:hypothetical protein